MNALLIVTVHLLTLAIGLWSGLVVLYNDKAWGVSYADYIAAIVSGFGAATVIAPVISAATRHSPTGFIGPDRCEVNCDVGPRPLYRPRRSAGQRSIVVGNQEVAPPSAVTGSTNEDRSTFGNAQIVEQQGSVKHTESPLTKHRLRTRSTALSLLTRSQRVPIIDTKG